jgi:hypothetical protein
MSLTTFEKERAMLAIGSRSPWGKVQHVEVMSDGFVVVSTAGHGGAKISAELEKSIPVSLRSPFLKKAGWYEEDCDILIPYYFLWDKLPEKVRSRIEERGGKDWLLRQLFIWHKDRAIAAGLKNPA